MKSYKQVLSSFIPRVEGFSSKPYWDVSRWSWGYGTRVPGSIDDRNKRPDSTITRNAAFDEMMKHIDGDAKALTPLLKVFVKPNQMAALLSFSYNLGSGTARKLIPYINSGNYQALEIEWKSYYNAGGLPNNNLRQRRIKEWNLFNS